MGCLTLLGIGVIAGIAAWISKPWAPDVEVVDPGPGGTRITDNGLFGNYYPAQASGGAPTPGILLLGGSEGGLAVVGDVTARLLRDQDYSVLTVSYFGAPGQPQDMNELPLEYFDTALEFLRSQPQVDPERIGIMGASKGGEATLLVASRHPEIRAVVAMAPSSVVWQGMDLQRPWRMGMGQIGSTWSAGGKPVSYLPYGRISGVDLVELYAAGLADLPQHPEAIIPVEKISVPFVTWCGENDTMWPSCDMSRQVQQRSQANGGQRVSVLAYGDAGHFAAGPPIPHDNDFLSYLGQFGGSPEGNNAARADGWDKTLAYLAEQLK